MRMTPTVRNRPFRTWRGRGLALTLLLVMGHLAPAAAEPSAYERGLEALAERRLADAIEPL